MVPSRSHLGSRYGAFPTSQEQPKGSFLNSQPRASAQNLNRHTLEQIEAGTLNSAQSPVARTWLPFSPSIESALFSPTCRVLDSRSKQPSTRSLTQLSHSLWRLQLLATLPASRCVARSLRSSTAIANFISAGIRIRDLGRRFFEFRIFCRVILFAGIPSFRHQILPRAPDLPESSRQYMRLIVAVCALIRPLVAAEGNRIVRRTWSLQKAASRFGQPAHRLSSSCADMADQHAPCRISRLLLRLDLLVFELKIGRSLRLEDFRTICSY
ncbi:uncharacterized protein B0H64DRAFT_159780 [Chaetomium fimeti]|uniref:Uncharacterized protein n=1 Tax=Chaetomium fimeti TaxID=1854472 RepID=A0AAE0HG38_9PEZI|nr:hypothetical protein B0H64DRAFT_159780 [Chaetomium fimeti]